MDYKEAIEYVDSFINFEKIPRYSYSSSFNLDRMRALMDCMGNPHKPLRAIHVAGSKGKGSTCVIIAGILERAGYKVGLYTSPHLLSTRERVRILERGSSPGESEYFRGLIGEEDFTRLVSKIRPFAEKFRSHKELGPLSFFEFLTSVAFLYFKEKNVDYAVVETGLGGRLDATNVLEPLVCAITSISLEHTDKLGNSLESITREKAGIIKNRDVFVSGQAEEALRVIRSVCSDKDVRLREIGRDITYSIKSREKEAQVFDFNFNDSSYADLKLNLAGAHQAENASLAIAVAKSVDPGISGDTIREALLNLRWPGRLQITAEDPYVILDGAQNVASVKLAFNCVRELFKYERLICILGILQDKDIKGVTKYIDENSHVVILTKPDISRAAKPGELRKNFHRLNPLISDNVKDALSIAKGQANKKDLILVTGSLYTIAEALKLHT